MEEVAPLPVDQPELLDRRLVARFQAGEHDALDEIVAIHQQRISRLVYRLLGWEDSEDIVQDVFLSVLQNLPRFRGESSLATWLTSITVNACRSHRRRRRMRLSGFTRWIEFRREQPTGHQDKSADRYDEIRKAVRSLPTKYGEPIILRYFEELPMSEVANILGLTINTVEVRLSRARRRLKERLDHSLFEEER